MAGRMGSAVIMDNAIGGDGFIAAVNSFCDHVGGVSFVALAARTKMRMAHTEGWWLGDLRKEMIADEGMNMDGSNDEDNEMVVREEKIEVIVIGEVAAAAAAVTFERVVIAELTAAVVRWSGDVKRVVMEDVMWFGEWMREWEVMVHWCGMREWEKRIEFVQNVGVGATAGDDGSGGGAAEVVAAIGKGRVAMKAIKKTTEMAGATEEDAVQRAIEFGSGTAGAAECAAVVAVVGLRELGGFGEFGKQYDKIGRLPDAEDGAEESTEVAEDAEELSGDDSNNNSNREGGSDNDEAVEAAAAAKEAVAAQEAVKEEKVKR